MKERNLYHWDGDLYKCLNHTVAWKAPDNFNDATNSNYIAKSTLRIPITNVPVSNEDAIIAVEEWVEKNVDHAIAERLHDIKKWFDKRGLDTAIVGFSGGLDSAVTSALCYLAGIKTVLVSANIENQTFSSFYGSRPQDFIDLFYPRMELYQRTIDAGDPQDDASRAYAEAALPIQRLAVFYGAAAEFRHNGFKPVVVGTINLDEGAIIGFWGKSSDAAQDFYPISDLHKSEVRKLAKQIGVPDLIINAVPSGDLQFSGETNDLKMIGATYDKLESFTEAIIDENTELALSILGKMDDPLLYCENVVKNKFKYEYSMGGSHLYTKLEQARLAYHRMAVTYIVSRYVWR